MSPAFRLALSDQNMKVVRGLLGLLAAGALALAASGALSASAHAQYRHIKNYGSGLCAGVNPWEAFANGATLVQQECGDVDAQKWTWAQGATVGTVSYKRWMNRGSTKCLDVRDGKNSDWTPVQQWTCLWHGTYYVSPQDWLSPASSAVPTQIKSRIGGRCLDVRGGSLEPGAVIQIYRCSSNNNNTAQAWTIE